MKIKFLFSLLLAGSLSMSAQQGYKDGIEYYKVDEIDNAKTILDRTINDASTDKATAYYYLGQIALQQGNASEAKSYFDKGIATDAANPMNFVGLGALDLRNGNKSAAEAQFKAAKNLGKKNPVMLTDIARAYFNADPVAYAKEIEKYIKEAKDADKKKKSPAPFILEGDILAKNASTPGEIGDAVGYYEMASSFDVDNEYPEAYVKYARVYFPVDANYAIGRLKELLSKNPNSALAQRELAEKYYDNNQLTMAAQQYGDYIKNPNHFKKDEQRYVGLLYFGKDYNKSFDLAGKLLAEEPDNFYMQRMQFLNKAALKEWQDADKYAKTFFANPKTVPVTNDYTTYGEVLQELGQDTLAVAQYEAAVKLNPEKIDLLKDLSGAYSTAKMYPEAAASFEEYIAACETPSTNDIYMLARRYQNVAATAPDSISKVQAADKAIMYVDQVLEKVPDNYSVANTKARILLVKNNGAPNLESTEAFKNVVAILDTDPSNVEKHRDVYITAYNMIANYYLGEKDKDTAKIYLNKFLEVDPENDALRNYIENMK